jgi:hypothetical protein
MDASNLLSKILSDYINIETVKEICVEVGADQNIINEVLTSVSKKVSTKIERSMMEMTNEKIHKESNG